MTELECQILLALERNQHRGGLTGNEIREVLGLQIFERNKMHMAIGRLIKKNLIQRQQHPTIKCTKIYSLIEIETAKLISLVFQNLPLHYIAPKPKCQPLDREFNIGINHPLFHESKLSEILKYALNNWIYLADVSSLPKCSGLYAFYGDTGNICLYVGQTLNVRQRVFSHPVWKQAKQQFDKPIVGYKIIEYEDSNKTKRELVYEESLIVGLLRPKWNIGISRQRHKIVAEQHELE